MVDKVDYSFISKLEGGSYTKGYVPAIKTSKSGVTIATGFDLGQRNEKDLKQLGLNDALIKKLKPYLGLQKQAAAKALDKTPLSISDADARTIDKAVKANHLSSLSIRYNNAAKNNKKFRQLPTEAQTVIASVSFQYGINLGTRTPKFWQAVTKQDWEESTKILKSFGDAYPTRRKKEATLLEKIQ